MEQAFGSDFSSVKVHTNAQSHHLNQSIQAKAFATGHDIFFRQGEYNPQSREGQELLAHELTHVVQQNKAKIQAKPNIIQKDSNDEEQNFQLAQQVSNPDILDIHKGKIKIVPYKVPFAEVNDDNSIGEKDSIFSDEKDSGLGVEVTILGELINENVDGYIFTTKEGKFWIPKTDIKVREAKFEKTEEPLFPVDENGKLKSPSLSDVIQGEIGNCYLEAAIASIIATDPHYIFSMFRDYGDTVSDFTKRFYRISGTV